LALPFALSVPTLGSDTGKFKTDKALEPTHWGAVVGRVYDAHTGSPIPDATVSVQTDGEFPATGRAVGKTDALGRYKVNAMLGRVSSNVNIGRLLTTGVFGLFGGAKKVTKRVDVSRLNIQVAREGCNTFEGVVPARSVDAARFSLTMEPILLTKAGSAEASTTAEGWGVARVMAVTVEPAILRPGARAMVTVQILCPPVAGSGDVRVSCSSDIWRSDLRVEKGAPSGTLIFKGDFRTPRSKQVRIVTLEARLRECPLDMAVDGERRTALVQVVTTDAEEKAAALRAEAFRLLQRGENVEAATRLKGLSALPETTPWDLEQLAAVSKILHDDVTAVAALKRAAEMTPEKERLMPAGRYASALMENGGDGGTVIRDFSPVVAAVREKDRPKRVPLPLMLALGNAYVQSNRLEEAQTINVALLKWPDAGTSTDVVEFRNGLRLSQARANLKVAPDSPQARAEYGRVLMDLGRWEEAVDELRSAAQHDPSLLAVRRDIAYALLHIKGDQAAVLQDLDEALAAAQKQVEITEGGKKSKTKDFFAWHALGMLLYTKAAQQRNAGEPVATETFARSYEALREALRCGRAGARVSNWVGYTRPRVVATAGFAYEEADSDFIILDSLKTLVKNSNEHLALFNLGTAFLDLGQPALAAEPLQKALAAKPTFVEAKYAQALVSLQMGDRSAALSGLRDTVQANPRHAHAHLILAKIYTEEGDTSSAAACLAEHAKMYGTAK